MSKLMSFATLIGSACLAITAASVDAGLVIYLSEQTIGGSTAIVANFSGSFNLSGVTPSGSGTIGSGTPNFTVSVNPSQGQLALHPGNVYFYSTTPLSGAFGTGGFRAYVRAPATSGSLKQYSYATPGPAFALTGDSFAISVGYNWGDLISDRTNFLTTTFADWGVTPGSTRQYAITGSSETVTINAIPEIDPAGFSSVLALLAGAFGLVERRRVKLA